MFKNLLNDCDFKLSIILSLLCILFVLVPPLNKTPVRIILGIPLVLFLPGYSLVSLLFQRKSDLNGIERIAFSLILSLATVPLLGLILNFMPFGLQLIPILVVLSAFTISVSLVAWVRRLKLPVEKQFKVSFERLLKFNLGPSVMHKGLSIVLIASIIGSSATLAYIIMTPKTYERFTEFYLLGPNGTASDYPTDLKIEEDGKVIICIINHEYENVTYRLEVHFNEFLIYEEQVFLIENEKLENQFTFKAIMKGDNQKLEFLLYNDQQMDAYRRLHIWVNVT